MKNKKNPCPTISTLPLCLRGLYRFFYMSLSFANISHTGFVNLTHFSLIGFICEMLVYIWSTFKKCYRKHLKMCDNVS